MVSAIRASVKANSITCGETTGTLEVLVQNGAPPYRYSINGTNWQTENIFPKVAPGTYRITITDDNGCSAEVNQALNKVSSNPVLKVSDPAPVCEGTSVDLTAPAC
jgi:hypothetical protein